MGRFLAFSAIIRLACKNLPKIDTHYINTCDNFTHNDFTYTGKNLPKIARHYDNTYNNFSYNDFTYTGNTYKS